MAQTPRRRLALRLIEAREGAGLTQEAVADQSGTINAGALSRWENGSRPCPADALLELARIYNKPLLWFYEQLDDAAILDLTEGLDPTLAGRARRLPVASQIAVSDLLPHLLAFAGAVSNGPVRGAAQ